MNTLNLILIIIFIVIGYLCYEKWRSNQLLEEKTIETYKQLNKKKNRSRIL